MIFSSFIRSSKQTDSRKKLRIIIIGSNYKLFTVYHVQNKELLEHNK